MPLDIEDNPAAGPEVDRDTRRVPLRERFATLRAASPLPPDTGKIADKAFFDDLSEGF